MSSKSRDASNADDLVELLKNKSGDAEQELSQFGGLKSIVHSLKTSTSKGLIATSSLLKEKERRYGANQLYKQDPVKGFCHYLVYSFLDVTLIILLIAAIASVVLGAVYPETCQGKAISQNNDNAWKEGVGIMATILVIVLISAFSDYYRNKHWHRLHTKNESERKITVIRSGISMQIGYRQVRVGDLVVLETGSVIPADGILVENTEVITDETSIGLQPNVVKNKKDAFVLTSTHVIQGQGKMLVLAVGERTRAGKIARENKRKIATNNLEMTGQSLQGKLTFASSVLGILGIVVGVIVMLVILISFLVKTYEVDNIAYDPSHWNDIIKAIIIGVVIIIVAEPEGLSLAATITMISSMGSMQNKNIFIRNPDMLETMGNVTAMCVKKHGVLTTVSKFVMREEIVESYIDGQHFRGDANDYKDKISENIANEAAVGIAVNTSYSTNFQYSGNVPQVVGDITEGALLEFVDDLDMSYRLIRRKYPEENHFKTFPFDPHSKYMTTVIKLDDDYYKIFTKGAPEVILPRCTSILTKDGVKTAEPEDRKLINDAVNAMVRKSQLKVLCLAQRTITEPKGEDAWSSKEVEQDYTLIAIMGIEGTMGQEQSAETRMNVAAGKLLSKNQFGIQVMLQQYLKTVNAELLEDFIRGVAVNTSYLSDIKNEGEDGLSQHVGDPRDCALLQFLVNIGCGYQYYRDEYPRQKHIEYKSLASEDESKQYTATVIKIPEDHCYKVYVKGGVNFVLSRSKSFIPNHPDEKMELDDVGKKRIFDECVGLQEKEMTVVAFAVKEINSDKGPPNWNNRDEILSDLKFIGYLGLVEEERGEISHAISTFRDAGMRISLVTGGSIQSSGDLAKKSGILNPSRDWPPSNEGKGSPFGYDYKVFAKEVTNDKGDINQQMFDKLWRKDELRVLASCPPDRSPLLIKGIKGSYVKESGEVVAAVASGVHDGSFLKEADVGISLGVSGANVAQESSDIILKEDKVLGLLETVKYGRHIYETVLKFLQFQLTATWVTLIVMIVGAILFQKSLFSATQLLWLNLIMDALASIALTRDQPTADILRHRPYGRNNPLISRAVLRNVIFHSLYQIAVIFILIYVFADFTDTRYGYGSISICKPSQHATMVFTSFILMQLFNEVNCRRVQDRNVFLFKGERFNCAFFIILILSFGIQILMVFFFQDAFRVRQMDAEQWLWCLFFGFSELFWGQIVFTIPKNIIPRQIRCCRKGVPSQKTGCCFCIRGVRSRDEIDAPTEFFGIANQPASSRPNGVRNSVNPMPGPVSM